MQPVEVASPAWGNVDFMNGWLSLYLQNTTESSLCMMLLCWKPRNGQLTAMSGKILCLKDLLTSICASYKSLACMAIYLCTAWNDMLHGSI